MKKVTVLREKYIEREGLCYGRNNKGTVMCIRNK
jgi:hypothetical protein